MSDTAERWRINQPPSAHVDALLVSGHGGTSVMGVETSLIAQPATIMIARPGEGTPWRWTTSLQTALLPRQADLTIKNKCFNPETRRTYYLSRKPACG